MKPLTEASTAAEQISLNQYKAGLIVHSDVVTAQVTALTARRALAQAVLARQLAAVALIQALGGGSHDPTAASPPVWADATNP